MVEYAAFLETRSVATALCPNDERGMVCDLDHRAVRYRTIAQFNRLCGAFTASGRLIVGCRFFAVRRHGIVVIHDHRRTCFIQLALFADDANQVGPSEAKLVLLAEGIQFSQVFTDHVSSGSVGLSEKRQLQDPVV